MRFVWLLPAPLLAACGVSVLGSAPLPDGGADAEIDAAVISRDGPVPPTTGDADLLLDADPLDAADGNDGACDPTACPGARCVSNACSEYAHCKDLHDNVPAATSRTYLFRRPTAAATFTAYCEMTLSGGGWTLVGQSAPNGNSTSFGWGSATGSVTDTSMPYSLNAFGHGFAPTETLLASGTRAAITAAYVVKVPAGFPANHQTNATATTGTMKIQNATCPSSGGAPAMMKFMGRTDLKDRFFYRDIANSDAFGYGLLPDHWDLFSADCTFAGGEFFNKQGMLFVR